MKMSWTKKKGEAVNLNVIEEAKKVTFDKKQEEFNTNFLQLLKEQRAKKSSRLCLGIWGEPKTGKTGIALDFPDRPIRILDWDRGVESTWREHHNATERIQVFCPIIMNKDNIIDFEKSSENSELFINYVRGEIQEGLNPVFVIDGVDSWFDTCLLKVNPNPKIVAKMMPYMYGARNKVFYFLMDAIYQLDCDIIYITHETEKYVDNSPVGMIPAWRDWGGKLEQEIHCSKKRIKNQIIYKAELVGSRTKGNLVGTIWVVREGAAPDIKWNGIPELREGNI
jgi:hypothetical protein